MARPRVVWPDAAKYLRRWLTQQTGHLAYSSIPTDEALTSRLPVYKVTRVGGSGDFGVGRGITLEVDTLASVEGLSEAVQDLETAMYALKANGLEGWYVDDVEETFPPAEDPYQANPDIPRVTATYNLIIRPRVRS